MRIRGTVHVTGLARSYRARLHRLLEFSPARVVIGVFFTLTALLTTLLMLPQASASGEITPFADALFTAVSAISVTGLATVDMGTHWSAFGDVVVVMGFQVGGIGVLTLASILGLVVTKKIGLRQRILAANDTNIYGSNARQVTADQQTIGLGEVGGLLMSVALSLVIIEGALMLLILPRLLVDGAGFGEALWHSYYLAASSFTNTGFVPFTDGLTDYASDTYLLSVLAIGVFLGSIGFPVIFALYRHLVGGGLRPHRRLGLHAKLTLVTTLLLVVFGWILIAGLEWMNPETLGDLTVWEAILASAYTSVMTRSGGLGILDPATMEGSTLFIMDLLMFIGGGSASTAGGIKVTTLAVLFLAAYAEARGIRDMQAFGRRIPIEVLRLAVSILIWGGFLVITSTVILLHLTKAPLETALFEVVSAFGTCGLTTGLSAELPTSGKFVLAATMWAGRVGTVTLAAAIAASSTRTFIRFPEERPIVG